MLYNRYTEKQKNLKVQMLLLLIKLHDKTICNYF